MSVFLERITTKEDGERRLAEIRQLKAYPTVIYGAGIYAREVAGFLKRQGVDVAAYVVDDPYADKASKDGIKPVRFGQAQGLFEKFNVVIGFCGDPYRSAENVRAKNVPGVNRIEIIDCRFWERFELLSRSYVETHRRAFEAVYDSLQDELSKDTLVGFLNAKMLYDPRSLKPLYSSRHYFPEDLPFFKPVQKDVFIDGGAYTGDTLAHIVSMTGGRGCALYFAFEPDERNAARLIDYVERTKLGSVKVFRRGLWSKGGRLPFQDRGEPWSSVGQEQSVEIDAGTIDELGVAASFIKMDIEGSEYEALKGAKTTLRTHKPKLAIAVYHKLSDLTTIPAYIRELCPGYRFYFRIHSLFSEEMVLYAVAP